MASDLTAHTHTLNVEISWVKRLQRSEKVYSGYVVHTDDFTARCVLGVIV